MAVCTDYFLDRVIKRFEERLRHFDNRCGYDFLLFTFEQLLLLVSQNLNFLKIGLASTLS